MGQRFARVVLSLGCVAWVAVGCGDDGGSQEAGGTNNGSAATNNGGTGTNNGDGNNGEDAFGPWQYLLIDDYTPITVVTNEPGADIDAIGLDRGDGAIVWAEQVVEDAVVEVSNDFPEERQLLGEPNAECAVEGNFVSLGGATEAAYIVVSFGNDVQIAPGHKIEVYELGPQTCEANAEAWLDEAVDLRLSVSNARTAWVNIGGLMTGETVVEVP